ncbi:MAG: hypothetical protein CMH31_06080 [Micavibrio sp.]|nr:hypothetical protein [Micavibrio sp.]
MARNVTRTKTKTKVRIDDLDYAILGILAKFKAAASNDPFALKMHVSNTTARIKAHLTKENMATTAVATSLTKLSNMKLVKMGQSFDQASGNLGVNTYEITEEGRATLEKRPETIPLISHGSQNDYQGPNIR